MLLYINVMRNNSCCSKAITTIHDNFLADLYSLTLNTVYYEEIDGEPYLINGIKGRGYHVGLMTKIPIELLTVDGKVRDYDTLYNEEKENLKVTLKDRLFFTNQEILMTNILLDNELSNNTCFDISFKDIESNYRSLCSSKRIQLTEYNCKRYISIINSLASKEIFLNTNSNVRESKYGANNLSFHQRFLTIFDYCYNGKNNLVFSYSFSRFGEVLKLSRRYSNGVPPSAYSCRLNQSMLHAVYYFIGREIFIRKGMRNKYSRLDSYKYFQLNINELMQHVHYDTRTSDAAGYSVSSKIDGYKSQPNKNRTYRLFIKYILIVLSSMKENHIIYDYEEKYDYTETENFVNKHESDYVGNNLNLVHIFSVEDIGQDVSITITIYLEPIGLKVS